MITLKKEKTKPINRITLFLLVVLLFAAGPLYAADIYVDQNLGANCANYSIANRNCSGSDGNAYPTVQAAIDAMQGGDDIYLRGGVYNESPINIPQSKDGTANDWSSIQSHENEWAVLDGNDTAEYVIGYWGFGKEGEDNIEYWKFEKLEVRNGAVAGFWISGGPFLIRHCYIHDNIAENGGYANPGGIKGMIWHDSIVEYNWFDSNGCTVKEDNCQHIGIHSDYSHSTHPEWDRRTCGVYNEVNSTRNNTYRYNLFTDSANVTYSGYKNKARQFFMPLEDPYIPHDLVNYTDLRNPHLDEDTCDDITDAELIARYERYKNYGDKIHHNIFIGIPIAIDQNQDFQQVYNNIADDGSIFSGHARVWSSTWATIYNNTIINRRLTANWGNEYAPFDPSIHLHFFSNIVDNTSQTWNQNQISIAPDCRADAVLDMSSVTIDRNYVYRPITSQIDAHYTVGQCTACEDLTTTEYNSTYGTQNYHKDSSEGTDNLYQGSSGADQYVARALHSVGGSTIENGGIGGSHPYLTGITIPNYIGATNPDNNAWVAGVLGLASPSNLQNGPSGDPAWIEDRSSSTDTAAPTQPGNLQATAVSSSQIDLTWNASSDNVVVAGYRIYRDGIQITTTIALSYSDTGLNAGTSYTYTLTAYDAAANESTQSSAVTSTTLSGGSGGTGGNGGGGGCFIFSTQH